MRRVSSTMGLIAGWSFILVALYICFDVLSRRFLGFSSQATPEVTGYLLAFGTSWGMAYALLEKSHIRVDVLVSRMNLQLRVIAHCLAAIFLVGFSVLLSLRAWKVVTESIAFDARDTTPLAIPLVYPQAAWAIGISVLAVVSIGIAIQALFLLVTNRPLAVEALLSARSIEEQAAEEAVLEVERESAHQPPASDSRP